MNCSECGRYTGKLGMMGLQFALPPGPGPHDVCATCHGPKPKNPSAPVGYPQAPVGYPPAPVALGDPFAPVGYPQGGGYGGDGGGDNLFAPVGYPQAPVGYPPAPVALGNLFAPVGYPQVAKKGGAVAAIDLEMLPGRERAEFPKGWALKSSLACMS